jgi:threonylcarbamoyladenosine tRNA methylthiotransferase MtaB
VKFSIVTFGCRVNQADSLALEEGLRARGADSVPSEQADVIIVNSCSVTCTADQGTRQAIRRAVRDNPRARVVVTGCYATRSPHELSALGAARVVPNDAKDSIPDMLAQDSGADGWTTSADRFTAEGDGPCGLRLAPGAAGRTAFTLRVQTGCDERCSYCIIPVTRGPSTSRTMNEVIDAIDRACDAGYREITLTGVHLGAYGRDWRPRGSLAGLLGRLAGLRHDVLFRLGSLEPMDCGDEVVEIIAGSARFAPVFHLPLQHASRQVLRAMRRPYTPEYYSTLTDRIRSRLPDAAIGSDIIVGFPGESSDDFDTLRAYLESSPLTQLHVFPYSDRPGTEASRMPGRAGGAIVRERARVIRDTGRGLARRFVATQLGRVHRALVIDDGCGAITRNGLRIRLDGPQRRNDWIAVRLRQSDETLVGDVVCA